MQLSSSYSQSASKDNKHEGMSNEGITGPLNLTLSPLERTFHPILQITIHPSPSTPLEPDCYALLHFTFPDEVFVDRDELVDRWGRNTIPSAFRLGSPRSEERQMKMKQKNEIEDHFGVVEWTIKPDTIDIERPVLPHLSQEATSEEGGLQPDKKVRLNIAMKVSHSEVGLEIPLHGRYLLPDADGEKEAVVFGEEGGGEVRGMWMCNMHPDQIFALPPPSPETSTQESDAKNSHCVTFQVDPHPHPFPIHNQTITLTLPTGHPSHQIPVEVVTALTIWLGWGYLIWKIWGVIPDGSRVGKEKRFKVE